MSRLIRAAAIVAGLFPALLLADAVVTFNEINYNPVSSQDAEWVELYNQMSVNMDISGWQISNGITYTFGANTIIPAKGTIVVAKNPANPAVSGAPIVKGPFDGALSNGGEKLELRTTSGRIVDQVEYGDKGDWPVPPDGAGATLAKRVPGSDSNKAESWTFSSTPNGTPGAANFPGAPVPILYNFVTPTSSWKYNDTNVAPSSTWNGSGAFNDSTWSAGTPVFGTTGTTPVLGVTNDLVQRWRAGSITGLSDGATLTGWTDEATLDSVSQNGSPVGAPTYRTGVTASGQPVVRLPGNSTVRASASPGIQPSSGWVYFIVLRSNAASPQNGIYVFDRDYSLQDNPLVSLKLNSGRFEMQKRSDSGAGLGGPISTTSISTTQFRIVALRRNTVSSQFEMWVDGTLEATSADNGDNLTPQPIVLGGHGANNNNFNGDVAEMLIYKSALSTSDFQSVGAYLEARYGLSTAYPDTAVTTPLAATTPTSYFRKTFTFGGNPSRTSLQLNSTIGDGAIFYLNGQEISRTNLPPGAVTHSTSAISAITQPTPSGFQSVPSTALVNGTNVLSVSLHKASGDPSSFFTAELTGSELPVDTSQPPAFKLNEIASTNDAFYFVEIRNTSKAAASTNGYTLSIPGGTSYALPSVSVPAGGVVSYTQAQLGFKSTSQVLLTAPGPVVADAQNASTTLGGRSDAYPDQWLTPSAPTPGAANTFNLNSDVVINEICYKAPKLPGVTGQAAVITQVTATTYDSTWRRNQTGVAQAAGWASSAHAGGSNGWLNAAQGSFYYGSTTPASPTKRTVLAAPSSFVTYYFETEFTLNATQAAALDSLSITHVIDDGAVFYLNGTEIGRYNMPTGTITAATVATHVGTAAAVGPTVFKVPAGVALSGSNRISVEVHQSGTNSSDAFFNLAATANIIVTPEVVAVPEADSAQQWIELYNRGTSTVDLSNWKFASGISYTFPSGTTLAPGAYMVVTRNGAAPPANPSLSVLGPWSGSLAGSGEKVQLVDAMGNTANEVYYLDGGRWPSTPDGGGASLELRDPRADSTIPESWSGSNESARRSWQTFTYAEVCGASAVGPDGQWKEFIFGLLDAGEILIDDITVTESPGGTPVAMITNGNFENGSTGWRFLGNHSNAEVITDPSNSSNHVLYLSADGATEHMHNHVETTINSGQTVTNGRTYSISFKVKWLSGVNKLNTRLYFNRLAQTTLLNRPQALGTPGTANSTYTANIGPNFTFLGHSPVVPQPGETVTITARAKDPDGLGTFTLKYSLAGASYVSVPMVAAGDGTTYTANIPGSGAGSVVRFYVTGTDGAPVPATSFYPAAGANAHALYQVNDGLAATNGLNNIRIVMDPVDKAALYRPNNLMSNGRIDCTVIYNESEIYYNAGVRLKSSERGRANSQRVGFNLSFNDDQLFRGVLKTVAIDRSEGQTTGAQEILYNHMMYASGGVPAELNDLCKVMAPDPAHTSTAILQLARFSAEFLDTQFDHGGDGTVYEYELIYYPTTTDASGYKIPEPDNVIGTQISAVGKGDDKENYRWNFLTKSSEDEDDYSKVIGMCKLFDTYGAGEFDVNVDSVLDVDQWLRSLAYACCTGTTDSYYNNGQHNGQFFARPEDGRMLYFPHDLDYAYQWNLGIFVNTELNKLIANPARKRQYLGHLYNICHTVFNQTYMSAWTSHYGSLLPNEDFSGHLSYINSRSTYILGLINSSVAPVTFSITTNGGANFASPDSPVTLEGNGWVDIRNIRLAGSTTPLSVIWTSVNTWQLAVPLSSAGTGANVLNLEAVDFNGNVVGTDSITVTYNGNIQLPGSNNLVVSELYYHPRTLANAEYVELQNISQTATIDMSALAFTAGITYTFANGTMLAPGARTVVIKNTADFQSEFGTGIPVASGLFTGSFDNAGEIVTLRRSDNTVVQSFTYDDKAPWPTLADTSGYSLVLVSPFSSPDHNDPLNWRASLVAGGTPSTTDAVDYTTWKSGYGNPASNLDTDGDGLTTFAEYVLGGNPTVADQGLQPTFALDAGNTMLLSITRRADVSGVTVAPESSSDINNWQPAIGAVYVGSVRLAGTPARDRLTFQVPIPNGSTRFFTRFAIH